MNIPMVCKSRPYLRLEIALASITSARNCNTASRAEQVKYFTTLVHPNSFVMRVDLDAYRLVLSSPNSNPAQRYVRRVLCGAKNQTLGFPDRDTSQEHRTKGRQEVSVSGRE